MVETVLPSVDVAMDSVKGGIKVQPDSQSLQSPNELSEVARKSQLHYDIDDNPPIHLAILFGFQIALMNIVFCVGIAVLTSQLICADQEFAASLFSTTAVMSGVSTVLQTSLGVRLPVFQGPSYAFTLPLLNSVKNPLWGCQFSERLLNTNITTPDNTTMEFPQDKAWIPEWNKIQGSLMVASLLQIAIGFFGLARVILRFMGPLQICNLFLLMGVTFQGAISTLAEVHWGIAMLSIISVSISSLYINKIRVPLPSWSRRNGFGLTWFPMFELFPVLLTVMVCWIVSHILTICGVFPDDPTDPQYNARTDFAAGSVQDAPLFRLPYPCQYGSPGIKLPYVAMMTLVVFISVLESVGDYVQTSVPCRVPSPPPHAVNRGILLEGICSFLSGVMGAGHATTSYSNSIGIIGVTKVASRRVYNIAGFLVFLMGICGKLGTALVAIPKPVLTGSAFITFALIIGTGLSNLKKVDLNSDRNKAILGISIMGAILFSTWVNNNPDSINTGFQELDQSITTFLGMHCLVGMIIAFFLEVTLPVNNQAKRLAIVSEEASDLAIQEEKFAQTEDLSVYDLPVLCRRVSKPWIANYLPFLPNSRRDKRMVP